MGTNKEIPTPYGSIKHTFDSGTQSNTTIRLRGKGIKSDKTSRTETYTLLLMLLFQVNLIATKIII